MPLGSEVYTEILINLLHEGKSFREEQCEKYNSLNYLDENGKMKHWIPKYAGVSPRDRCKLFCRSRGSSEFKVFESKVMVPVLRWYFHTFLELFFFFLV